MIQVRLVIGNGILWPPNRRASFDEMNIHYHFVQNAGDALPIFANRYLRLGALEELENMYGKIVKVHTDVLNSIGMIKCGANDVCISVGRKLPTVDSVRNRSNMA